MSTALAVYHGKFGRATLYRLNKPLATHAHREGHLVFLIDGPECSMSIGDHESPLTKSFGSAVNPWEPHSFNPSNSTSGSIFLTLYIKPIWFLEFGRSAQGALRFGRNAIEMNGQVARLVHLVSSLLMEDEHSDLFDGYLYELTLQCYDQSWQWVSGDAPCRTDWSSVRDFRIRKSIHLMRERIGDEIALEQVAHDAGLSRPHFFKLFRENIGVTPNIYLNTLRMETSIDRLTSTSDTITSIGLDLGFASQASFSRFFTANVGIPPTDYRRATMLHG
ncbi:MAG: helix-turn-helix domain-containing protein [Hyphomicrobiales bacterium]